MKRLVVTALSWGVLLGVVVYGVQSAAPCDGWTNAAKVCVSSAVLELEFKTYTADQPPPIELALAQARNMALESAANAGKWHACEANLANATLPDRQQSVKTANEAAVKRLNDVAPMGANGQKQHWDDSVGKYVDTPVPAPAPTKGQ